LRLLAAAPQVPLEIRLQTDEQAPQDVGTLEAVMVKVLVRHDGAGAGAGSGSPAAVRIELSNENDLFFHFSATLDAAAFRSMREEQHLMVDFEGLVPVLGDILENSVKAPTTFLAVLLTNREGQARLDFIQNVQVRGASAWREEGCESGCLCWREPGNA
jgi:hypothetical protein